MQLLTDTIEKLKTNYPKTQFVIRYHETESTSIQYIDEKLNNVLTELDKGIGIHAFSYDGYMGFACSNVINPENVYKIALQAKDSLDMAVQNRFDKVPGVKEMKVKRMEEIDYQALKEKVCTNDIKRAMERLYSGLSKLKVPSDLIVSYEYSYVRTVLKKYVYRTDGTEMKMEYPFAKLELMISVKKVSQIVESGKKGDDSKRGEDVKSQQIFLSRAGKGMDIFDNDKQMKLLQEVQGVINLIDKNFSADSVSAGHYKLLLDGRVGGVFIHEAFGHTAEADSIKLKSPLAKSGKLKIGEKIAPSYVNIYEETKQFDRGFTPFSPYGFERKRIDIVKHGVLSDFLSDIGYYDEKSDGKLSGNSRAASYCDIPISRMSNTVLKLDSKVTYDFPFDPYQDDIEQIYAYLLDKKLVQKEEPILYLIGPNGGEVSTGEGTFQFSANFTFLLHEGKVKMFKGVSFSGKTLSVLSSVINGSSNTDCFYGSCGKIGQWLPVLAQAPQVLYLDKSDEITIA